MRSTVYKATAAAATTTTGPGLLEPGPEEEEEPPPPPHLRQPPPPPQNQIPVPAPAAAAAAGPKGRAIVPAAAAAAAPGQQQQEGGGGCCWGGLVPSPCPVGSTRQAGVGDAAGSSRPSKYQAVLPGHTAAAAAATSAAAKDCKRGGGGPHAGPGGAPASLSPSPTPPPLPPPPPVSATAEPGQPPPAPTAVPAAAAGGSPASSEPGGKWKSSGCSSTGSGGGGSSLWKSPMGAGGGASCQTACLKQILLLQLDLIEQQQQQLQAKEKEIEELKAEKDTLFARIERMERRMQLVKKDNEREKHKILQGYETEEKVESEVTEKLPIECQPPELLETSQPLPLKHFPYGRNGKGHKRKSAFGSAERKTPVKKLVAEFSKVKCKTPKASPLKEEPSSSLTESISRRELRSQETPEKTRSLADTPLKSLAPLRGSGCHSKDKGSSSETEDLPYLSTTEMYLCRWHQPPPSPLRETSPKKEEIVAIPSWRDHMVEPLRDLNTSELLENLDDNVFSKRHAKLELDEKRRKRWDIQRIREQRILQRLQLRMYKKKGIQESEPEVTSFFPESDDVESLLITPYLPVVAFGRPLPKLNPQNFELPWLDERSRCRLEMQKKQTPHRTCRK
ncbi:male-specific lethal 1 homolog [Podarcis muralis]|uniref:CASC3 exon junction complex subunit n=1 Tax=Podarcis muralis TaxID=64176 RepID=A0A670JS33_PODMU|nr:male-specific lethal 1 homolog [Podarcis muralis]XP_028558307.1 male-specific lethal 1 homolog [Podarcis muralis]